MPVEADEIAEYAVSPDRAAREVILRARVSRAYYAAFHLALAYAEASGFAVRDGESTHAALWNWYQRSRGRRNIGMLGKRLHGELRIPADYDLSWTCTEELTDEAVAEGTRLREAVRELPTPTRRS